jgi:hypothetical protein
MKNLFRKKREAKPRKPRFCDKGHDLTNARCIYFYFPDAHTEWLCPFCFVEFMNEHISGIKEGK